MLSTGPRPVPARSRWRSAPIRRRRRRAGASHGPARIMIVGDSITQGSAGDYTWQYWLYEHLKSDGIRPEMVGPTHWLYNNVTKIDNNDQYANPNFGRANDTVWGMTLASQKTAIGATVTTYRPNYLLVLLGLDDLFWYLAGQQTMAAKWSASSAPPDPLNRASGSCSASSRRTSTRRRPPRSLTRLPSTTSRSSRRPRDYRPRNHRSRWRGTPTLTWRPTCGTARIPTRTARSRSPPPSPMHSRTKFHLGACLPDAVPGHAGRPAHPSETDSHALPSPRPGEASVGRDQSRALTATTSTRER